MSWMYHGPDVRADDWRLIDFMPTQSKGLMISQASEADDPEHRSVHSDQSTLNHQSEDTYVHCRNLLYDDDYREWLQEASCSGAVNVIAATRTSCLDEYPFTREVFNNIKNKLMLHGSIVRVINRNLSCHFSATLQDHRPDGSPARYIAYNCKTSGAWPGSMALSITFIPETLTTNALWFGCDPTEGGKGAYRSPNAELIRQRLSGYDGEAFHPLLLPTMLADLERDRLVQLVRELDTNFLQKVFNLQHRDSLQQNLTLHHPSTNLSTALQRPKRSLTEAFKVPFRTSTGLTAPPKTAPKAAPSIPLHAIRQAAPQATAEEPSIHVFIKISYLRNGLGEWRTQLLKMIEHVDELQRIDFGLDKSNSADGRMDAKISALTRSGLRIRGRLQELVDEFEGFIRTCTHVMEGMTLATQLELAHIGREDARFNQQIAAVNLEVAKLARRDGNLMKSIALLGMIFLPGTFVATFFSMDFFDWPKDKVVSPYIWVYMVVTVILTGLCLFAFYFCILRRQEGSKTTAEDDSPA